MVSRLGWLTGRAFAADDPPRAPRLLEIVMGLKQRIEDFRRERRLASLLRQMLAAPWQDAMQEAIVEAQG